MPTFMLPFLHRILGKELLLNNIAENVISALQANTHTHLYKISSSYHLSLLDSKQVKKLNFSI